MNLSKLFKSKATTLQSTKQPEIVKDKAYLKKSLMQVIEDQQIFKKSNFYTSYLEVMLEPLLSVQGTNQKELLIISQRQSLFEKQKILTAIMMSITTQQGILYAIINLWVGFCDFKITEILEEEEDKDKRVSKIIALFHEEYFLLSLYLYNVCLVIYQKPIESCQELKCNQLLKFMRNSITECEKISKIHQIILKNVVSKACPVTQEEVQENMAELQKICKISKIPIPFFDCLNLMKRFYRQHILNLKIQIGIQLVEQIRKLIGLYRFQNQMNEEYLIAADDMFSALAYILWRVGKNVYGACVYIEAILCSQFAQINFEITANQLQRFGENARHSFELIKSISNLGLLPKQLQELL